MSRPHRVEYAGATYHITSRGNARERIYLSDQDRESFLSVLSGVIDRYRWVCHGYCLMSNHYHLLIETQLPNLSLGMRQLNGLYTTGFNRQHRRTGHVFQGRFKAIVVERQTYLTELNRYIALNPVKARTVKRIEAWKWSSYPAFTGAVDRPTFLTTEWILGQFGKDQRTAIKAYRSFVLDGMTHEDSPLERIKGQIYLGSNEFARTWSGGTGENPRMQRRPVVRSLSRLLSQGGTPVEIEAAAKEGYKMAEIARHLDLHYTTVSQRLKRARDGGT